MAIPQKMIKVLTVIISNKEGDKMDKTFKIKSDRIIESTMWDIEHPYIFKFKYIFLERRVLANWEVFIIIISCSLVFLLIGYIMGSGRIPLS